MSFKIIKRILLYLFLVTHMCAGDEEFREAFESSTIMDSTFILYDKKINLETSNKIMVEVPSFTENSFVVPISIKSKIPLKSIAIMQEIKGNKSLIAFIKIAREKEVNYKLKMKLGTDFHGKIITISEGFSGKFYKTVNKVSGRMQCCYGCEDSITLSSEDINLRRKSLEKNIKYKLRLSKNKERVLFMSTLPSFSYAESLSFGLPVQFSTYLQLSQENEVIEEVYLSQYISYHLFFGFSSIGFKEEEPIDIFIKNINGDIIEFQLEVG